MQSQGSKNEGKEEYIRVGWKAIHYAVFLGKPLRHAAGWVSVLSSIGSFQMDQRERWHFRTDRREKLGSRTPPGPWLESVPWGVHTAAPLGYVIWSLRQQDPCECGLWSDSRSGRNIQGLRACGYRADWPLVWHTESQVDQDAQDLGGGCSPETLRR